MAEWLRREKEQWTPSLQNFRLRAGLVLKAALIGMFLCHALFVLHGYTSPDGTNEGLYYYWNQRWALSIGRWLMRYLSAIGANVVMPALFVAFNAVCTAFTVLLLADLWKIRSKAILVLATLSLLVAPSVIEQNLVIHVAYSYGFSMVMTVLAAYLVLAHPGAPEFVLAVLCLTLGLGGYQAWVGFTAGVVVMTLLLDCAAEMPLGQIGRRFARAAAMGLLGGGLYFAILQIEIQRYDVALSSKGGRSSFGAGSLAANLMQGGAGIQRFQRLLYQRTQSYRQSAAAGPAGRRRAVVFRVAASGAPEKMAGSRYGGAGIAAAAGDQPGGRGRARDDQYADEPSDADDGPLRAGAGGTGSWAQMVEKPGVVRRLCGGRAGVLAEHGGLLRYLPDGGDGLPLRRYFDGRYFDTGLQ